jgi:hypothetical protein
MNPEIPLSSCLLMNTTEPAKIGSVIEGFATNSLPV